MIRIGLVTLVVRDYDEAIRWFVDVLGFVLHEDTPLSDEKRWVVIGPVGGDTRLLLARATGTQTERIGDQTGGRVAFFLRTDDFAATHDRMVAAGVQFAEAPRIEPYGTVAVFVDLYGNRWDLVGPIG
ncbi:MAG TPA: VOC family protein [Acidimicrobiales bacterium]|nr:VOC family protein [Acidimicrobiales bacterium]